MIPKKKNPNNYLVALRVNPILLKYLKQHENMSAYIRSLIEKDLKLKNGYTEIGDI